MKTRTARTQVALAAFVAVLALQAACATILPGNDPVVVNAERVRRLSAEAVDSFTYLEARDAFASLDKDGKIRKASNRIREEFPKAHAKLVGAVRAYKSNRNEQNRGDLSTWVATVEQLWDEVKGYLALRGGV